MVRKNSTHPERDERAALPISPAQDASGALREASQNLKHDIEELRPRESVYLHYGSLDSFYEIMDSARLRFTSARSTNDPSEFLFGLEQVKAALSEPQLNLRPKEREWFTAAQAQLESRQFRAFVFCMSEASEDEAQVGDLSQWRLYGANGRGVALVFDVTDPRKRKLLEDKTSIPRRVAYGTAEGQKLVRTEIQRFVNAVRAASPEAQAYANLDIEGMAENLLNVVFWMPSVIKHNAYRHEREVRLVRGDVGDQAGNPLIFFERGGIRRPAIEISLNPDGTGPLNNTPIRRVIIGPSGDQAAIADSIKYFLEARNWDLEVLKSDIPYRAVG
jgi:hypothetical protein